jgi:hypothetical protein
MAEARAYLCPIAQTPEADLGHIQTQRREMKFIHLFLIGYFVLVVGIGLALWQAGIFNRVSTTWIAIGLIVAAGAGIMMAVSSGKPTITTET